MPKVTQRVAIFCPTDCAHGLFRSTPIFGKLPFTVTPGMKAPPAAPQGEIHRQASTGALKARLVTVQGVS